MPYIAELIVDHSDCEVVNSIRGSGCKMFFIGYNTAENLITHTLLVEDGARGAIGLLRNNKTFKVYSTRIGFDKVLVIVSKKPCHLCQILYHGVDYTVLNHVVDDRGRIVVRIAVARFKTIENLVKMLEKKNYRVLEVNIARCFRGGLWVTKQQLKVLEKALSLGYYEQPRRVNLDELARELGMSKSTVASILRRVEAKAVKMFYEFLRGNVKSFWLK